MKLRIIDFKQYKEHQWYGRLIILLLVLVFLYVLAHLIEKNYFDGTSSYEYSRLDDSQKAHLNKLYFDSASIKALFGNNASGRVDSTDSTQCCRITDYSPLHNRALKYIYIQLNHKIYPPQFDTLRNYLKKASPMEGYTLLNETRFKIQSNFWLVGPSVYWEIVFWSWFGVISSIIFNLALIGLKRTTDTQNIEATTFDSSEIPHQIAKLLYAPLCTLVIILGYNFFQEQNIVDIDSSKGVIVFAFIGGFYSSRLIAFLDRLKEVVLPSSSASLVQSRQNANTAGQTTEIQNLKVQVSLDPSVPQDVKDAVVKAGIKDVKLVLEDKSTKEKVMGANPRGDNPVEFIIPKIKQGTYIITANWSKEIEQEVVSLTSATELEIKNADKAIDIPMKVVAG